MAAAALRQLCRAGEFTGPTAGQAAGFVQANLVILKRDDAEAFAQFCEANAAPCPLLEYTDPGCFEARRLAPGSDLRKDLPKYRVWRDGVMVEERADVTDLCTPDMQAFLLGCSFSWESALESKGLTPRHVEEKVNVPMFNTSIALREVGPFKGSMVVSMRPYKPEEIDTVIEVTEAFPAAHGGPVQIGNPESISISDISKPDYGDRVKVKEGEIPIFWACGVTPQAALTQAKLPFAITHAPGHMFVSDVDETQLAGWDVPGQWAQRPNLANLGVDILYTLDRPDGSTVSVAAGSVVEFRGDAIVNAANEGGIGGGGVDGAINRAGGQALVQARYALPIVADDEPRRIPTGEARITVGGNLPGKVIHAVGPMYFCEEAEYPAMDEKLRAAYTSSFDLARQDNLRRVGCSLISSGVFSGSRDLEDILRVAWNAAVDCGQGLDIVMVAYQQHELDTLLYVAAPR